MAWAGWLLAAAAGLALVVAGRRFVTSPLAYGPLAVAVWYCTYRSGIHPTIAAVALGLLTPAGPVAGRPVLEDLEHRLHPWSSYLVIPVFALANAGVALNGDAVADAFRSRLTWAVIVGLVVGKLAGIAGATMIAVRTGLGRLPAGLDAGHVLGAGRGGRHRVHRVAVHHRPGLRRRRAPGPGENRDPGRLAGVGGARGGAPQPPKLIGGRRLPHGWAASSWAATRKRRSSRP